MRGVFLVVDPTKLIYHTPREDIILLYLRDKRGNTEEGPQSRVPLGTLKVYKDTARVKGALFWDYVKLTLGTPQP